MREIIKMLVMMTMVLRMTANLFTKKKSAVLLEMFTNPVMTVLISQVLIQLFVVQLTIVVNTLKSMLNALIFDVEATVIQDMVKMLVMKAMVLRIMAMVSRMTAMVPRMKSKEFTKEEAIVINDLTTKPRMVVTTI